MHACDTPIVCATATAWLPLPPLAELMKRSPDPMMSALLTHNGLMRKALWTNFGYTLEQEGGEPSRTS